MNSVSVAIIGNGLSGLYAALLLAQKGIDYILLEARDTLGGRIIAAQTHAQQSAGHSNSDTIAKVETVNSTDSFDLGPSWFGPIFNSS